MLATAANAVLPVPQSIRCPVCGAMLGELRDGVSYQRYAGRWSIGATLIGCDRRGCDGVWKMPEAMLNLP